MQYPISKRLFAIIFCTTFLAACSPQTNKKITDPYYSDATPHGAHDPSPRAMDAGLPPGSLEGPITQPVPPPSP